MGTVQFCKERCNRLHHCSCEHLWSSSDKNSIPLAFRLSGGFRYFICLLGSTTEETDSGPDPIIASCYMIRIYFARSLFLIGVAVCPTRNHILQDGISSWLKNILISGHDGILSIKRTCSYIYIYICNSFTHACVISLALYIYMVIYILCMFRCALCLCFCFSTKCPSAHEA